MYVRAIRTNCLMGWVLVLVPAIGTFVKDSFTSLKVTFSSVMVTFRKLKVTSTTPKVIHQVTWGQAQARCEVSIIKRYYLKIKESFLKIKESFSREKWL